MAASRKRLILAGAVTALCVALLAGLGAWQLSRLHWKEALIARIAERMAADPVAAPKRAEWPGLKLDDWSYRRVRLEGVFDNAREAHVYVNLSDARGPLKGPGYFVMTPLALTDGGTVIVNRGFAPERKPREAPPASEPATVVGPLREPEARNAFTPDDEAYQRLFFVRDPKAIAEGLGLADAAPFTVDAEASGPGGAPQGGETRVSFPNRHLEYALTWFGLAATLAVFFAVFAWRTRRDGDGERL